MSYRLTASANVTVEVVDAAGISVATIVDRVWTRAGSHTVTVDASPFLDGAYSVVVSARSPAGLELETVVPLLVSRTLGLVAVTPSLFSPNGDGRNDRLAVSFSLTAAADVVVRIVRDGRWVASPHSAGYEPGAHTFEWNGVRAAGPLRDGAYAAVVEATDAVVGMVSVEVPFTSDTTPPRARILPARGIRIDGERACDALPHHRRCASGAGGQARWSRARAMGGRRAACPCRRSRCRRQHESAGGSREEELRNRRVDSPS